MSIVSSAIMHTSDGKQRCNGRGQARDGSRLNIQTVLHQQASEREWAGRVVGERAGVFNRRRTRYSCRSNRCTRSLTHSIHTHTSSILPFFAVDAGCYRLHDAHLIHGCHRACVRAEVKPACLREAHAYQRHMIHGATEDGTR